MSNVLTPSTSLPALPDDLHVSEAVVSAVAEADGVSEIDVRPPLGTVIDPEALERIVASLDSESDETSHFVRFAWAGYDVTVADDGFVSIDERDD